MPMLAAFAVPMLAAWKGPAAAGRGAFVWRCRRWWWGAGVMRVGLADGGVGGFLVDDGFACGVGGDEGLDGEVVDGAGVAACGGVDEGDGVVAEEGVGAAGEVGGGG